MNDKPNKKPVKKEIIKKNNLAPERSAVQSHLSLDYKKLELAKQISREQVEMLNNIESYLQEYLDDFIVIGHAVNGARVNITSAKTAKDQDSLEQFYTDNLVFMKHRKMKDIL